MERTTKVINMFGGSGIGKSTTAAGLYHQMKLQGLNVELVREYVKGWAWAGTKVNTYDQVYIFGKQARSEYMLYGKVDYIVTDSPILLSPIYDRYYNVD
jgi:ATP:corrinoid adenosyltransferase